MSENEKELLQIIRNSADPVKVLEYAISQCIAELRKAEDV